MPYRAGLAKPPRTPPAHPPAPPHSRTRPPRQTPADLRRIAPPTRQRRPLFQVDAMNVPRYAFGPPPTPKVVPEEYPFPAGFDRGAGDVAEMNGELQDRYGRFGYLVNKWWHARSVVRWWQGPMERQTDPRMLMHYDGYDGYAKLDLERIPKKLKTLRDDALEIAQEISEMGGKPFPVPVKLNNFVSEIIGDAPAAFLALLAPAALPSAQENVDKPKSKRAKHEAIVGPAVDKNVAYESVGIKIAPKPTQKEPPVQSTTDKELAPTHDQLEEKHFVTPQEIEKEKLPPEEILSLPMFKNYTPGNPSSVLCIKNLAKVVMHDDFYYVFGSLFESMDTARSGLRIKLMQEERMRGQAFVTFPTVELAQRSLNLVHGYVFKGKPMIIQFGGNPAANKAS